MTLNTGQVFKRIGWRHEVWTGESAQYVANLRWLAAFRSPEVLGAVDVDDLAALLVRPGPISHVESRLNAAGLRNPRALVMHAIWLGLLRADLDMPIGRDTWVSVP